MRIASSGEVMVIGAKLLVDVGAVDLGLSMVGESMAITLSWARFPSSGSWSRALSSIHTLLTLGVHARSEGYCSYPVCVCVCVCMYVHSNLPPHTLEKQKRDTNRFIAIQERFKKGKTFSSKVMA